MQKTTPFLYLAALASFSFFAFDLYQPSLPSITKYFNTTEAWGQLTLSLFFMALGLFQLFWGPIIDHFGRKITLIFSLVIFLIATIVCLEAAHITTLIVARVFQGIAVCCASVIAFSSARDLEDTTERARMLSHIIMIISISPIFAPIIGSLILVYFDWQANFALLAIMAILLMMLIPCVQESPHWRKSDKKISLNTCRKSYFELLTHKQLWISIFIITGAFACGIIFLVNIAYLVIDDLRITPVYYSLLLAVNGVAVILGNCVGIKLRKKRSLTWNIRFGALVMMSGAALMMMFFYSGGLSITSLAPNLIINMGASMVAPPALASALSRYPKQAGMVTGLISSLRTVISAILAATVGAMVYYDVTILPLSLLLCSTVCLFFGFSHQEYVQEKLVGTRIRHKS